MTICAILLAAGESSRMGQPKPMLPWQGETLVRYQVASLLRGGVDEVYVVTGRSDAEVAPELEHIEHAHRVFNPDFEQGKTTSVRAGVASLPTNVTAIVLIAVDQPRPSWVVRRVLDSHIESGAPLTSPRFRGHGGHPLIISGSLREELSRITEASQGIREVFKRHESKMNSVEFDTEVIRLDLNTPAAYAAAVESFAELARIPE